MSFKAGAIVGEAILNTAKWTSGIGIVRATSKKALGAVKNLAKIGLAAVGAGMTAAIYQANEYQKEFSNVSTLTDQNTKALQEMSLGLLSLQSELGSTRDLTRAMYDAISAGAAPGKEAFDVITGAAKFAKAGVTDNAAAVKLLSATVNAYGKDAKTMSGDQLTAAAASDIFFTTIRDGVITGEELAATIGQSIPLFASMKIPVEQLASGLAAMTKQGVNSSEATTQLNAIVNAFLKPSEALSEVLADQGYQSGQAFIEAKGLTGALDLLKNATEGGGYEIADLTGNIRAMKGVLALSGEGAKIFKDTLDDMASASGAVDIAFGKQEKTFQTMKNELQKSSIIFGNIGKFFVDDIAGGAQEALESINSFITSGRALDTILPIVRGIAGAFGVIKEFATGLYNLFEKTFLDVISDIGKEFGELFGEVSNTGTVFNALATITDTLGAALNIVLRIVKLQIVAYIDLGTAALNLIKTVGTLWEVLIGKKTFADVKASLTGVKESFKELGTNIVDNVKDIVTEGKEQWQQLTDDTRTQSDAFANAWKSGSDAAAGFLKNNYSSIVSGFKEGNEDIKTDTEETISNIVTTTSEGLEKTKTAWDSWRQYVTDNLKNIAQKVEFWMGVALENMQFIFDGMEQIASQHYTNELSALENRYKTGLITEEEYNKEKNKIAEKQFKANKAFTIANIWMGLAQSVMGFWQWGAPLGPPGWAVAGTMSGIATGIAIAQTILAAKQQYVPSYAEGTNFHPGGMAIVGEEGPEILNLPRGARVRTNAETMDYLENSAGKKIEVNINNPVVREENDINRIANAVSDVLGKRLRFA